MPKKKINNIFDQFINRDSILDGYSTISSLEINNHRIVNWAIESVSGKNNLPVDFDSITNSLFTKLTSTSPFPEKIRTLKGLRKLVIKNNNLEQIPYWLVELQGLGEINLEGNNIKKFPTEFTQLKRLARINLANNCLEELPLGLEVLQLEELYLKG